MYIITAEQADASNYCNLQGSNSSLKYISPYWKKGLQISSEMRGNKCTGSQEAAAIWKITVSTCCKSGEFNFANSFHCAVAAQGWAGWMLSGQAPCRADVPRCFLGSGQNEVQPCLLSLFSAVPRANYLLSSSSGLSFTLR